MTTPTSSDRLRQYTRGREPRFISIDEALCEPGGGAYACLTYSHRQRQEMTVKISDDLKAKGVSHTRCLSTSKIMLHGGKVFLICNAEQEYSMQGLDLEGFLSV